LANRDLANGHLANGHLANGHLANGHLANRHLADRHSVYTNFYRDGQSHIILPRANWSTSLLDAVRVYKMSVSQMFFDQMTWDEKASFVELSPELEVFQSLGVEFLKWN
jgi:hypothetical protein